MLKPLLFKGLDILHELLQNVGRTPNVAQAFYQQYLLSLIQDVFAVMTDRLHKSGFKMHATLLRQMFHLVQMNQVTVPLFDPATQPPGTTNPAFLREHVCTLLITSFPNLSRAQVAKFVDGMFDITMDLPTFKTHLRDFLIELKEFSVSTPILCIELFRLTVNIATRNLSHNFSLLFSIWQGEDNSQLFEEEKERQKQQQEQAMMAQRNAVPGLVKPEIVDDDDL
jgi:exportin-1